MTTCIFGSGYLAGVLAAADSTAVRMRRMDLQVPAGSLVVDCSFPQFERTGESRTAYLELIYRRIQASNRARSRYLYLGSFSSQADSKSWYGKVKFEAEQLVIRQGGIVLRVPLVVQPSSPGGRFAELVKTCRRLPAVPLPDHAAFPVSVCTEQDLLAVVMGMADSQHLGTRFASVPHQTVSLADLLATGARITQRRTVSLGWLGTTGVRVLQMIPIDALDSLRSLEA